MPLVEPDWKPEDYYEARPKSRGFLGWLSIGLALLAIPGMSEPATLPIAFLFAIAAVVVGILGVSRWSSPVPAFVGIGLGLGALLVAIAISWYVSELERWEF